MLHFSTMDACHIFKIVPVVLNRAEHLIYFNRFHANVPFLYPLKTSENKKRFYHRVSYVFNGLRNGTLR